jgi:hypothetical protein
MGTQASQLLIDHLSLSSNEWNHLFCFDATLARAEYIRSTALVLPGPGSQIPGHQACRRSVKL